MDKTSLIFGIYPVLEALNANTTIDKVFIQKGILNPNIEAIVQKTEKRDISISYAPKEKLNRLTKGNHQGVIAITSRISFHSL